MTKCVVPGCKENGNHLFPKDRNRKMLWAKIIKRPELVERESVKLCSHHFTQNDYKTVKSSTGFNFQRRILKEDAVPSIFPWSKVPPPYAAARKKKQRTKKLKKEQSPPKFLDEIDISDSEISNIHEQQCTSYSDTKIEKISNKSTQTSVPLRLFATDELLSDDKSVKFYTGLDTYKKFKFVLDTLYPMAYNLCCKLSNVISLSVEDQFLLTLIKLRRNYCNFELSKIFGVSESVVANVFETWLNFMCNTSSFIDLWPAQDLFQYYTPENFENKQIIIDSTEVPIHKPTKPLSEPGIFDCDSP